jgi:kynureninase
VAPGQVIAADSTSVNLFKAMCAALAMRPDRPDVLVEADDFPTDRYIAEGVLRVRGRGRLRVAVRRELARAVDERTGVVVVSHVNYRTGELHDLRALSEQIQARGALVCWDLSHSAGAMPIDFDGSSADFAVGCGYKFLNGGPGAPGFVAAAACHLEAAEQPLSGWFGHADPFAFSPTYEPAVGIMRFATGTPPILGLTALECGVDVALDADLELVRAKSLALGDLLIEAIDATCAGHGVEVISPRDHSTRGSQVSVTHPNAYELSQALIAHGVVGDFRPPNILRFGLAPLYLRYVDIADAWATLADVLTTGEWDQPHFRDRMTVT